MDFLAIQCGSLCEQAFQFLEKVIQDHRWFEDNFLDFINFQLARACNGKISESTIATCYKVTKLFLEMNNASMPINWKKICRGLPRGKQAANDRAPT